MNANSSSGPTHLIRRATVNDCLEIADLCGNEADLAQMAPQEAFPLTPDVVANWLTERNSGYVMEDENGAVLAYAELNPDRHVPGRFWIGHLAVNPRIRSHHVGRRLVKALSSTALGQMEAEEVWISAFTDNPAALACYRGAGFQDVGTRPVMGRALVDLCQQRSSRQPIFIIGMSALVLLVAWMAWWWRQ